MKNDVIDLSSNHVRLFKPVAKNLPKLLDEIKLDKNFSLYSLTYVELKTKFLSTWIRRGIG